MDNISLLILWTILLNALAVATLSWCLIKLVPGNIRNSIIFLVGITIVYINMVLAARMPGVAFVLRLLLAKSVMATGATLLGGLGLFVVYFSNSLSELKSGRFWVFQFVNLCLILALYTTDIVLSSVALDSTGLIPVYGFLHKYWLLAFGFSGLYIFYILISAFRNSESEIFRYQVALIFWTSLASFLFMFLSSGVLPVLTGKSGFVPAGAFGLLFFYIGITYVINNAETLYITRNFRSLLQTPLFREFDNLLTVKNLIGQLDKVSGQLPENIEENFRFTHDGQVVNLLLYNRHEQASSLLGKANGGLAGELDEVEREVLFLVASGLASTGVAYLLKTKRWTVDRHIRVISKKLGAKDELEMIQIAKQRSLI